VLSFVANWLEWRRKGGREAEMIEEIEERRREGGKFKNSLLSLPQVGMQGSPLLKNGKNRGEREEEKES
jgi:hypothetical protein